MFAAEADYTHFATVVKKELKRFSMFGDDGGNADSIHKGKGESDHSDLHLDLRPFSLHEVCARAHTSASTIAIEHT